MARGFVFFVFALLALILGVMSQSVAAKNDQKEQQQQHSEWVDEDPKMQLAGDSKAPEQSRAKVFLEATGAYTAAPGPPSAPSEVPKETGQVPAPGKYTHVTSGGARLGAIPLPDTFERLWKPPAPAPAPAAAAPAPAPSSGKKGKAVAGKGAPKKPKAAPPAKAPKKDDKKAAPVVVPAKGKKGAGAPAPAPVAAPAPAPIDSSVVSVASMEAEGPTRRSHGASLIKVDDDGNVVRCHTGPDGEERCH